MQFFTFNLNKKRQLVVFEALFIRLFLVLILAIMHIPILYDIKKSIWKNVLIIFAIMAVIQIINYARIFLSVWWRISFDVPRWLYHDLPDTLLWYPICIGLMVYGSFKFHPISAKIETVEKV